MDNTNEQRIISFCTGGRMLDMGLERVVPNLRTVAAVEIEAFCAFNLAAQTERPEKLVAAFPVWTDIKTFDARPFRHRIHGFTGGYPCQPFSAAGRRKGTADPRHLWPYFERHIDTIRPLWCFFENVEGHLSLGYDAVHQSLEGMGYTVEAGIYSAAELGATQVRKRLFILATTDPRGLWHSVAHTNGQRRQAHQQQLWKDSTEPRQIGENVGHTNGDGRNRLRKELRKNKGDTGENGCRYGEPAGTSFSSATDPQPETGNAEDVAITDRLGIGKGLEKSGTKLFDQNELKWPAGPGQPQYPWEAPRAVEPGLGCTVDGYNFRRDLLRMYGNGVVPPVAAHAFYDLLLKQCRNLNIPISNI